MKRLPVFLLLLILVACRGNGTVPPTVVSTAGVPTVAAAIRPTPTNLPATNTPVAEVTLQPPTVVDATESPAELAPDPTNTLPPVEPEVVINGITEEGAFFRGRADAPVTFIDYSDFL